MSNSDTIARPLHFAFVTGGSGFVGRNLIAALRAEGVSVRALVRSSTAVQRVQQIGAEPVQGDLDNLDALRTGMQGCDVVFHVAANASDWGKREDFYRANVTGTNNVLSVARATGVPRFVHVSTEAVLLGGGPIVRVDESRSISSSPIGLYSETKGLAEQAVRAANTPGVFETIVIRPRFIWGKDDTSVLALLIKSVKSGSFAWINQGRYLTSTCHVDNVCEGLLLAARSGRGGEVYFLTDGDPKEFRIFITAVLHTQGIDPGSRSIPRWLARAIAYGSEWAWHTFHLQGSPPLTRSAVHIIGEEVTVNDSKARRELGYQGHVSKEAGLAEMASAHTSSNAIKAL